ncbi:MAG: YdcF family protein, partial [Acidimicrobiia bacterium]|nr:YdcF family protein [Acidimicrobiia bacterium]
GLPQDRIVTTGRVATTEEEADAVAGLLGAEGRRATVLLVTSAFHMARAQRLFEQVGLHVNPYPVDFSGAGRRRVSPRDLLPSPGDFALTHRALRELYGRAFYRLNPF